MANWLLKTEPGDYSFAQLQREGRVVWDGVTNPLARKYLGSMAQGDEALIYHTGREKAIVGVARVATDPYWIGDPPAEVVVDVMPLYPLPRPVTLAEMRGDPAFAQFELLRLPRLSVVPVPAPIRQAVLTRAGCESGADG